MRARRAALLAGASLIVMIVGAATVLAQDRTLGGKLRSGDAVAIPAGETVTGDVYLAGGSVSVDGTVDGDVVAAGGSVVISGNVSGDLLAAGGTVTIAGSVGGDARVAGGQLNVTGEVGEDVLATGGQVTVGSSAVVGQDLIVSGGQVSVAGTIVGSIAGSAGTYSRTGTVGGADEVVVSPPPRDVAPAVGDRILDAIRHFLVVLLFGFVGLWLAPRAMRSVERRLRTEPLGAFVWGLFGIVGFVVALVVLAILGVLLAIAFGLLGFGDLVALDLLLGAIAAGALSVAFAVAIGYLADAIVGLALGRLVADEAVEPSWRPFAVLAVGAGVVVLLTSLPVVGPWLKLLVAILGLGAILAELYGRRRSQPSPSSEPPAGAVAA